MGCGLSSQKVYTACLKEHNTFDIFLFNPRQNCLLSKSINKNCNACILVYQKQMKSKKFENLSQLFPNFSAFDFWSKTNTTSNLINIKLSKFLSSNDVFFVNFYCALIIIREFHEITVISTDKKYKSISLSSDHIKRKLPIVCNFKEKLLCNLNNFIWNLKSFS